MEQFTIEPPKDLIDAYYITQPVPVEFEFVGRGIRLRYTFRNSDVDPLVATGNDNKTASDNMLKELVRQYKHYISLPRPYGADHSHVGDIISELEGFIEASSNPDGYE